MPNMFNRSRDCRGATIVEFALSISLFVVVMFGVIEFGRLLFLYNMATKATQMATRLATTCNGLSPTQLDNIKDKVRFYIESSGQISTAGVDWLEIQPDPVACDSQSPQQSGDVDPCWITSRIKNLEVNLKIPGILLKVPLPEYRVTQVREAMTDLSPVCQ